MYCACMQDKYSAVLNWSSLMSTHPTWEWYTLYLPLSLHKRSGAGTGNYTALPSHIPWSPVIMCLSLTLTGFTHCANVAAMEANVCLWIPWQCSKRNYKLRHLCFMSLLTMSTIAWITPLPPIKIIRAALRHIVCILVRVRYYNIMHKSHAKKST